MLLRSGMGMTYEPTGFDQGLEWPPFVSDGSQGT
jgi:hypothetical protein